MQRTPALAHRTCPGGDGMEPATAPRPDMAPELTPEEEQVSASAAVGVSEPPRPRPASVRPPGCAPRPGALSGSCSHFRPAGWPPPAGDRAPGHRPALPGSRGTPGSEILRLRDFRGGALRAAPFQ